MKTNVEFVKQFRIKLWPFSNGNNFTISKDLYEIGELITITYSENREECREHKVTGRISPLTDERGLVLDISEKFKSETISFNAKPIREICKKEIAEDQQKFCNEISKHIVSALTGDE